MAERDTVGVVVMEDMKKINRIWTVLAMGFIDKERIKRSTDKNMRSC